ncbi:MAG: hypothetical protein CO189_01450 [candidate division Zixibacteria bacterium CG_4_9_14_3_um_filter_46_8]|nr:MAG: hypothetical protein CO189_01450 [candidate division Zixibacteria bacterium CG_4_9_14_3_um_filter_46_8]
MSFELFDKIGKTFSAKISIRSNGNIGFSKGAINKYNLAEKAHCRLYYDQERNLVGFKFVKDEEKDITTRLIRRGADMIISARSFLTYYGIDFEQTKAYIAQKDEENDLIFIDLNKAKYESTRGRRKK